LGGIRGGLGKLNDEAYGEVRGQLVGVIKEYNRVIRLSKLIKMDFMFLAFKLKG
jgi:hypothetical protein